MSRTPNIVLAFDKDWFLSLMKMENLYMKEVAAHLKIDASLLSGTVRGNRRMKIPEAEALALLFKVPLSEVFFRCGLNEEGMPDLARGVKQFKEKKKSSDVLRERIVGYKTFDTVRVASKSKSLDGKREYTKRSVQPRAFLSRNESIQIMYQLGGGIEYPNGLMGGLHYRVPSDRLEIFANAVASLQFEQFADRTLELHQEHPELSLHQLIAILREEVAELACQTFTAPVFKD